MAQIAGPEPWAFPLLAVSSASPLPFPRASQGLFLQEREAGSTLQLFRRLP